MTRFVVVALLVLAACKGKDKPEAKPVEPKVETNVETKPAEKVLVFAPVKMIVERGGAKNELAVDGAGKVLLDGKEVGSLSTAGELTIGGKVVATLTADGKMTIVGETGAQLTITPIGALVDKDGKVALEPKPDGMLGGAIADSMRGTTMKLEGDKAAYRALMFAWMGVSKNAPPQ
jgi:hypothetical protein